MSNPTDNKNNIADEISNAEYLIHTSNEYINDFVNLVILYIDKIIGVVIDVRYNDDELAQPEWFDNLKVDIKFTSKSYLPDGINAALKHKKVYDAYYYNHYNSNSPELKKLHKLQYPKLSSCGIDYIDILQLLADEINKLHIDVENASDNIEFESTEMFEYFKQNVTESTTIEELIPKIHEYFDKITGEAEVYSMLNNVIHEIGFEMCPGDSCSELLESRYYVQSTNPNNEGWWSVEHDIYNIINKLENELEYKYPNVYKTSSL